jgi:hypothetical protein
MNQPASTSVVKNYGPSRCRSDGAQIFGRGLARLSISDNVVRDLLSLVEALHSGAFDRADMHEHILAAVIWLDEAKAFLAIEPFHGSLRHISSLRCVCNEAARQRSRFVRVLEKSRQSDAMRDEAKSFGRSSIDVMWGIAAGVARFTGWISRKSWLFGRSVPI